MNLIKLSVIGLVFGLTVQQAAAEVYSCGPGCYTSKPSGSRAQLGNKIGSYTATVVRRETPAPAASSSSGGSQRAQNNAARAPARSVTVAQTPAAPAAPRLSAAKASGRRTILEQELNNERSALANAQKALAEGRAVSGKLDGNHQARIRQLESAVLDRQQNIQALQRELGRM